MTHHTVIGGTNYGGIRLGILMLDSIFPRIVGEMGNAQTWDFPVCFDIVKGANVNAIVEGDARDLYTLFLNHAKQMVAQGCTAITTNCGFLSLLQDQLKTDLGVPVATSSLMQYAMVRQFMPPAKTIGIITINRATLTDEHLRCAGVDLGAPMVGLEGRREINRVILSPEIALNIEQAQQDVIDAGLELQQNHSDLGAIVLECTNLSPYSHALNYATGLPIFDIYTMIRWFAGGLNPRYFNTPITYPIRP